MGWYHDDRLLWLGVAISSVVVTWAVLRAFDDLDAATRHTAPEVKRSCVVDQQTEDDVSAADLVTLSKHPSRHISEAAIKILVLRAVHDEEVVQGVETDLANALAGVEGEGQAPFSSAYKAKRLMRHYAPNCFAPRASELRSRNPEWFTPHESVETGTDTLQEVIEDGAEDTIENLLGDIDTFDSESNEEAVFTDQHEQWSAAWLEMEVQRSNTTAAQDITAETTVIQDQAVPRSRRREGSPEEQARRRRRREAIVLNEGNRPLTQQDIIQRHTTRNA